MNSNQRMVLVVSGVLLVANLLFPPWDRSFRGTGQVTSNGRMMDLLTSTTTFDGYGWIGRSGAGLRIATARLFGQSAAIGIVAAVVFVCMANKTPTKSDGIGEEKAR